MLYSKTPLPVSSKGPGTVLFPQASWTRVPLFVLLLCSQPGNPFPPPPLCVLPPPQQDFLFEREDFSLGPSISLLPTQPIDPPLHLATFSTTVLGALRWCPSFLQYTRPAVNFPPYTDPRADVWVIFFFSPLLFIEPLFFNAPTPKT